MLESSESKAKIPPGEPFLVAGIDLEVSALTSSRQVDVTLTVTFRPSRRIVSMPLQASLHRTTPSAVFNPSFRCAPTSLIPGPVRKASGRVRGWSCLSWSLFSSLRPDTRCRWQCRVSISSSSSFPVPGASSTIEFSPSARFLDSPLGARKCQLISRDPKLRIYTVLFVSRSFPFIAF